MKRVFALVLALSLVSAPGCVVIVETLIDALLPKRGTSKEPGISKEERQTRWEEEQWKDFRRLEKRRELERYRRQNAEMPEWRKTMEQALSDH